MTLKKLSPCKVNLLLNVLGKRPDGFHELETVLHPVNFCDTVHVERAGQDIRLTCNEPSLPTDATNLVSRAAAAFFGTTGLDQGVRVHLEKKIPLAAGLGGGSGNAAATLLALNELFGDPLSREQLQDIAALLGSDVPFFLQNGPALATGRGEKIQMLEPFPAMRNAVFLLIHPGFGIATAWAYQQLSRFPAALQGRAGRARELVELLQTSDLRTAGNEFYNSLEGPALQKYPLLALFQEFLREQGATAMLMSGSGSTTFALVEDMVAAQRIEAAVRGRFGRLWTAVVPV